MFRKEGTRTSLGLSLTTIYLLTPEKKKVPEPTEEFNVPLYPNVGVAKWSG